MTEFRTSTLGWVYICLGAVWTVLLAGGILYLHRHRRLPFLQIRRLPIIFIAVTLLHLYAVVCLVSYTIHPIIPCDAQFWIMSIYLPFGIALLQAANSQFLYIASQQRRYASYTDLDDMQLSEKSNPIDQSLPWWKRMAERVYRMDRTTRIIIFIGLGMAVEVRRSRYAMMVNYEHMLTRSSWHSLFLSISVPRYSILIMDFSTSRSLGRSNSERPCVSPAGNGKSANPSLGTAICSFQIGGYR